MGMKKSGKRLLRLGKEAARALGAGGKEWVEAVFQTAIKVIDEELNRSKAKPAPKARAAADKASAEPARLPAEKPSKRPVRKPSKTPVKKPAKKQPVARGKSGVRAPGKPAAKPRRVSARPRSKSKPVESPMESTAPPSEGVESSAPLADVPPEVVETGSGS